MSDQPTKATAKEPAITYADVLAIANQLTDSNQLTTAWTKAKLESKPAKDFTPKELAALKEELDEFAEEHAAANEV